MWLIKNEWTWSWKSYSFCKVSHFGYVADQKWMMYSMDAETLSNNENTRLNMSHFVHRSFRTQVISYHFGHFVPTFIFNLVISYPVRPIRIHFILSLVISYLLLRFSRKPFWSFRTYFLLFCTQVIPYPKSFRNHFNHFQTRYELTLVWNYFFFAVAMYSGSLYGSLGARWKGRTTFW